MKRWLCALMVGLTLVGNVSAAEVPSISAASAVLMDADSGRVLFQKNSEEKRLIASITKLMTALVALESGHSLDETVAIRPEWTGIEGSSLYLKPGERVTLETLLYGLLLRSGNDAAHAVAGYCAGDVDAFVAAMNEKAAELGMHDTHFANPSGLNGEEHYSTALDMAILARACLENETLEQITATKTITLGNRMFTNHNKLLWRYEGCVGMKTGYTEKAGRTLVSAARREGMTLICVTLNAPSDWADHTALLDYGFETFQRRRLVERGEVLCWLPVEHSILPALPIRAQEDRWTVLRPRERVERQIDRRSEILCAPCVAGMDLGCVTWRTGGEVLARVPMVLEHHLWSNSPPERSGVLLRILGR